MLINNDIINYLLEMDEDISLYIIGILNIRLKDLNYIAYPLSEAYYLGYKKGLELFIQLLSSDLSNKNTVISYLENIDTYIYNKYSCRGQFIVGLIKSQKLFLDELVKCRNLELYPIYQSN